MGKERDFYTLQEAAEILGCLAGVSNTCSFTASLRGIVKREGGVYRYTQWIGSCS
jgi:hypothetical protein